MAKKKLLSRREYADHRKELGLRGGTYQTVCQNVRQGKITCVEGKIDPDRADREWLKNTKTQFYPMDEQLDDIGDPVRSSEDEVPSYTVSKARVEAIKAISAQLDLDEKTGTLVKTADVYEELYTVINNLKQSMLLIPQRVAPEIASLSDITDCEKLLEEVIAESLEQLSEEIARSTVLEKPNEDT